MGLGELWLTYGPGSPGGIARAMAQAYRSMRDQFPHMSKAEILRATLFSRHKAFGGISSTEMDSMLSNAGLNLSRLTVEVWMRECPNVSGAMLHAPDSVMLGVRVIENETRKIAPDAG
jgi:hypothetical protein